MPPRPDPFRRPRLKNRALHALHRLGLARYHEVERALPGGLRAVLRAGTHDEHVAAEVFERGAYPIERVALAPGDAVVDVGAQIGMFTLLAAGRGARVLACEPAPPNLALLRRNLALNGLEQRVEVHALAVAAHGAHEARLHLTYTNTGGHSIVGPIGPGLRVPALGLEALFDRLGLARVRLLKLDVEGAEYPILYSAPAAALARIEHLFVEAEDHPLLPPPADPTWPESGSGPLRAFLEAHGFEVEAVESSRRSRTLHARRR